MSIKIDLGMRVRDYENGFLISSIPLRYFLYNLLITGKSRTERSAKLSYILNQLYERLPDIGVLLIKLQSNEDLYLYHLDKVFKYGDSDLMIPYFFEEQYDERNREQFKKYINAIFGFHPEMKTVIACLLHHYKFPSSIIDFLEDLKNDLMDNPYSDKFTRSNVKSFDKVIHLLQNDPILERTVEIPLDIPEWLKLWSEGKVVCIDLSECDLYYQKILVAFLLQALRNLVPEENSDILRGIIVLEDSEQVLRKAPREKYRSNYALNREYYSWIREKNYFITKEQLDNVFGDKEYLLNIQLERMFEDVIKDEFRYRNLAVITTCEGSSDIIYSYRACSEINLDVLSSGFLD